MTDNLKDFLFRKLFAPQVIIINQPGVIISKTTQKYGKSSSKRRMLFVFEDVCVAIQNALIKKTGETNTSSFYYKMGKDVGFYYMILSGTKKISSFLVETVIKYIFYTLSTVGQTFGEQVTIDVKKKYLCLKGYDNIISRKTKNISFFAGFSSGIFSYLLNENIEAKIITSDNEKKYTVIELSKINPFFYLPNVETIKKFIGNYEQNFPKPSKFRDVSSYKDLLKHKKIQIEEKGKNKLFGYSLLFTEVGFLALLVRYHLDNKYEKLLQNAIVSENMKIFEKITISKEKKDRLKFISSSLSALGWGIVEFNLYNDRIICNIKDCSMYEDFLYFQTYSIKGGLQTALKKEVTVKKYHFAGPNSAKIEYSL